MIPRDKIQVFAGNASKELGKMVCAKLGINLGNADVIRFPDQEINLKINGRTRL
jgi:phosphoribosylpyrophosphate synthetase